MPSSSDPRRSSRGDTDPISLNLARIVHRLMTDARGWRLDRLEAELGVKAGARKKYVRRLREEFAPFSGVDGGPRVEVVREDDGPYLRLVGSSGISAESDSGIATIAAIHLVSRLARHLDGTPLAEAVDTVYGDVRARTKDARFVYRDLLQDIDRKLYCAPDAEKAYAGQADTLRTVLRSVIYRHPIAFSYRRATTGALTRVSLHPLTLLSARGSLYVAGREFPQRTPTKFELSRIEGPIEEDRSRRFRYPDATDYHPSSLVEGSFGVFTTDGPEQTVRVVFAAVPWLRRILEERRWHDTQKLTVLPDGRVELVFRVRSLVGAGTWLFGLADFIEELEPDREAFRAAAAAPSKTTQPTPPLADAEENGDDER